jgi:hypothetical protein
MNFPLRININFSLPDKLEGFVKDINNEFINEGYPDVDFVPEGSHLPHITLLMGTVNSKNDLDEILRKITIFKNEINPIEYTVGHPYWKEPSQKFAFVDTLPLEIFKKFRLKLLLNLNGLINCEFHGGPENPSHITVGYGDKKTIDLKQFVELTPKEGFITNSVRVCIAGERGTCSDILLEI